jgi:tetratricopeptide (TPR) repeat protein
MKGDEKVVIDELSFTEKEIELDQRDVPKAIRLAIMEMRQEESALIRIKDTYLLHHYKKNNITMPKAMGEPFDYMYCEVTLKKFYTTQNLMDNGEIKKKILFNGKGWRYAKLSDKVTYSMTCTYDDRPLFERNKESISLDCGSLYEIELRVLQNIKLGEVSEIIVKPVWLREKNAQLLKDYNIEFPKDIFNEELNRTFKPMVIKCEIFDIEIYEYIFKPNKDMISKKRVLHKGFGKDSPDRESYVVCNTRIKVNGETVYNDFSEDVLNMERYNQYSQWREEIYKQYNIQNIDDEDDFIRDQEILNKFRDTFKGTTLIDLRHYSIPIVMRKVLIHMKRNEIAVIHTNSLDYFNINGTELINLTGDVEICIHLYEFLHRVSFSKLTYTEKLKDLSEMKDLANSFYKENKLFRACKIYQNINSRFTYGDVFNSIVDMQQAEDKFKSEDRDMYEKLCEVRLSSHSNLANAKFRLKKFNSAYEVSNRIISEYCPSHKKALYIKGKCCVEMRRFEEAVETFRKLNELYANEFIDDLKSAEELYNEDIRKQKNRFRKMIFSN